MTETSVRRHRHIGLLVVTALTGALVLLVNGCQASPGSAPLSTADLEVATSLTVTTHIVDGVPDALGSGLTWEWEYDSEDRLTKVLGPGGVVTRVSYSLSGEEPMEGSEASSSRVFAHDEYGRLLRATDSDGEVSFGYHATGMPAEVHSTGAPVIRYFYDVKDRLTEMRIGDAAIRYSYDYLGRPAAVATPVGAITFSYDRGSNRFVRRLPNGVRTVREYDDEGKLTELIHVDANNYVIAEFVYAYRPDGLIAGIVENTQGRPERACRYEYDLMQRLIAVGCEGAGRSYRYRYDELGNLAEAETEGAPPLSLENDPTGALISHSRGEARVDDRGHIRQLPGQAGAIDYDFNLTGDLAGARAQSIQYRYNALGLLAGRSFDGKEAAYLPDPFANGWQPLWRRSSDGKEAVVIWDGAVPLVELEGDQVRFRLEDHLGSVRAEVDRRGNIVAWHDYSPFGAPEDAGIGNDLRPGFAGLYWDPGAQVYHAMARAYDPGTARFLQPDPQLRLPEASKLSHSLYAYCGGDPVNFVDRSGAQAVPTNPDWIWWNAFFSDVARHLFDATRAKQVLATLSERHLANARGSAIAAATTATLLDIVGGYIPGTPASINQGRAQLAWSLLFLGGGRVFPGAVTVLRGFSYGRTAGSAVINASEGNDTGALLDLTSMGLNVGSGAAGEALTRNFRGGFQYEFAFIPGAAQREAWYSMLSSVAPLSQTFDLGRLAYPGPQDIALSLPGAAVGSEGGILPPGVLASTTGPGKRGGRGGGITRPPSWRRPGRQGGLPPGPQPRPGGRPPPGSGGRSRFSPSPVGGVYLGGSGAALEGLGELKGVAIDETTGRLVLIGSDEQRTNLPPLRLDDLVTVFRGVYDHGESPSVTIDPDERNPKGPIMHVKHGPGTEGTYVGWILFESDRIMKTYQLGRDNVTREIVRSQVPEHSETVDLVFFGDPADGRRESSWERFWIVPAAVNRFDAASGDLSLFELPLKVNTQKMRWEGGKLVDDEDGESSVGALTFRTWFSEHFDEIADEVLVTPPPGSAIDSPVAVFHELRRIAVIAAVAERLRDQGQTMPVWMRDYSVAPFPVPETTPSLTLERSRERNSGRRVANIYGGVNLAPADNDVRVYTEEQAADATLVRAEDLPFVTASIREASELVLGIPQVRTGDALGKVKTIVLPGTGAPSAPTLLAAALPGGDSRALGPNRQTVTDLDVPIGVGRSIRLTRSYNSFFDPSGVLGKGWTLDLPRLLMTPVPVTRDGKRSEYRVVPTLISPLGSWDIRFDRREIVESYGVEMYVAQDHPEITGLTGGRSAILDSETDQVLFRDGTEWHFDDDERLVLVQRDGTATRYVRDSAGRIGQLVGYVGTNAVAEIRLAYDQKGRIVQATPGQADFLQRQAPAAVSDVHFEYDGDGRLAEVTQARRGAGRSADGEYSYSYGGRRLTSIESGMMDLSFGYDDRGVLLWEEQDARRANFAVLETEQGTVVTQETEGTAPSEWTYDARMQPVKVELDERRTVTWEYGANHAVVETMSQDGEPLLTRTTSQDGRTETVTLKDGPDYTAIRDARWRPTGFFIDDAPAAEFEWEADGTLQRIKTEGTEVHPRRHEDGWPNGVLISAPMESGTTTTEWLEEEWDVMGRPTRITDSSGFEYAIAYNDQGRLRTYGRVLEDGSVVGADLTYRSDGRIADVQSSWDRERRQYGEDGVLRRVEIEREGVASVTTYDAQGRQATELAFDGGTTTWQYDSDAAGAPLAALELPNKLRVDYVSGDDAVATPSRGINLGPASVNTVSDARGRVIKLTWRRGGS